MSHWVTFPSATLEKANQAVRAWRARGYKTLVFQDRGQERCEADRVVFGEFPGYYKIANALARECFWQGATVVTAAADDMLPDENSDAEDIMAAYFSRFPTGFGVLQACGDMQGKDKSGVQAAARICGSPTFGEDWCRRAYGGRGPFCDDFTAFFGDEDLFNVASLLGVLWLARQYKIDHLHWSYRRSQKQAYHERAQKNWNADKCLFEGRKRTGFPGHEPLEFAR